MQSIRFPPSDCVWQGWIELNGGALSFIIHAQDATMPPGSFHRLLAGSFSLQIPFCHLSFQRVTNDFRAVLMLSVTLPVTIVRGFISEIVRQLEPKG